MYPLFTIDSVFHVGSLDPADKGRHTQSLEGSGLSVSVHPDEWAMIARLGGNPTWTVRRCDLAPIRFLDAHRAEQDVCDEIVAWATLAGLIEPTVAWSVTWDDPDDGPSQMLCDTEADALLEADPDFYDDRTVSRVDDWACTDTMRARLDHFCPIGFGVTFATLCWAEDVAGTDGVWWNDRYDPAALSCPRGVIHRSRLDQFDFTK